jgi:hypothetical protein
MTTNARELAELATAYAGGNGLSFRNRIINGDMRIAQRGTAAVTASNNYPVDRFSVTNTTNAAFSAQQDSSAPEGFTTSVKLTITTARSSGGGNLQFRHSIEGFNIGDLDWGTANAKPITLSFWVRSSETGTFSGVLRNSTLSRAYPFTYSIVSANTWEFKTVTISGDTSGTWLTDNGTGIGLTHSLYTSNTQAAGAWFNGNATGATGSVQLADTLNATWQITGVQLEAGSVATPFERRPYGTELALCQRYYESMENISIIGSADNANNIICIYRYLVEKRASPTGVLLSTTPEISEITIANRTASGATLQSTFFGTKSFRYVITGFSGMTTRNPIVGGLATTTPIVGLSAEL